MIARIAVAVFVIALAVGSVWGADAAPGRVLFREDFNSRQAEGMADGVLKKENITLAKGAGPDGTDAIRVAYEGFERGSRGAVVIRPISDPVETATLSFDVQFEEDFQWVMGGKLHGLGPKTPVSGGRKRQPEKWSARLMWGANGACSTYLYDQTVEKKYGVGSKTDGPVFKKSRWHHLDFQVQLNTPGKSDGFARLFVDGKMALETQGVQYRGRGDDDTLIHKVLFSTFHGGNKPMWAPKDAQGRYTTVHALYDNFVVREGLYCAPVAKEER